MNGPAYVKTNLDIQEANEVLEHYRGVALRRFNSPSDRLS